MSTKELTHTTGYPVNKRMSAKFEGTFAYKTLKDRMPKIVTQVIDTVNREESNLFTKYGEAGTEDVKAVLSELSRLRYQLQTNKTLECVEEGSDTEQWRRVFASYQENNWFTVSWLFAECHMYRKIAEAFQQSMYMKDFDPFQSQKEASFHSSLEQISEQASRVISLTSETRLNSSTLREDFEQLVLLCLWGNKMDLSMMATVDNYDASLGSQSSNLLANHTPALWTLLQTNTTPRRRIDFVVDNSGFEIFTDMCLAEWLLSSGLAHVVVFHCKVLPWFVSDVTIRDFRWIVATLASSSHKGCSTLGQRWLERMDNGSFIITDHSFWTTPYEFAAMETVAPELYQELTKSVLVFFKGDLNYRKLLADRNWLYTMSFSASLGGFNPTNVCALRTLKADLVVGLPGGVANRAAEESKDWMVSGQYAVIQLATSH